MEMHKLTCSSWKYIQFDQPTAGDANLSLKCPNMLEKKNGARYSIDIYLLDNQQKKMPQK